MLPPYFRYKIAKMVSLLLMSILLMPIASYKLKTPMNTYKMLNNLYGNVQRFKRVGPGGSYGKAYYKLGRLQFTVGL